MAFYPLQVEKILDRYESLSAQSGEFAVRKVFDEEELALLDEFLAHGHEVRAERARAAAAGEKPDFVPLMRRMGRRVARVPQGHARLARLPAEPRGDHQVARGRHRVSSSG